MAEETFPSSTNTLQVFQPNLLPNEKIIWTGQPRASLLSTADYRMIPMMLGGVGGLAGMIAAIAAMDLKQSSWSDQLPFLLLMVVMLPFIFYLLFGRLLYRSWKNKRTYYAITDRRILMLFTAPSKSLQAIFIDTISVLNKSINSKGIGTISFGDSDPRIAMYANTGLDFLASFSGPKLPPAFYDIENADRVYELIIHQRGS